MQDLGVPLASYISRPRSIEVSGLLQEAVCRGMDGDACDRCTVCHRIDRGVYPDIHLVEPQGQSIKIDQIRQL